jgi:hypothetical protein
MTEYHFDSSNSIAHNFNSTNKNQTSNISQQSATSNLNSNIQSKHNESISTGVIPPNVIPYNEEYIHKVS